MRPRSFGGSCLAAVLVVGAIGFVGGRAWEYAQENLELTTASGEVAAPPAPRSSVASRAPGAGPTPVEAPRLENPAPDAREPAGNAGAAASKAEALGDLRARALTIPVPGVTAAQLRPTFDDARGGRRHEALDIMAPRGTPVVAVDEGRIAKLFTSRQGGLTVYQFDLTERYVYYYAHLDRYAEGLREGQVIGQGQMIGYVGSTGNASPDAPHLHFAIMVLGPERNWWEGTALDPFRVWR